VVFAYVSLSPVPNENLRDSLDFGASLGQTTRFDKTFGCQDSFDTVGEFPKQRTYAFRPIVFKELTQLILNSPKVSVLWKEHSCMTFYDVL
jgi:hypothetical protein